MLRKTPPEKLAQVKQWYNSNTERKLAQVKDWKKRNPEKVRAARSRYQKKKRAELARLRPPRQCAEEGCNNLVEPGQKKYCKESSDFILRNIYRKTRWKKSAIIGRHDLKKEDAA